MSQPERDVSPPRARDSNPPAFRVYAVRDIGIDSYFATKEEAAAFMEVWRNRSGPNGGPRPYYRKHPSWIEEIEVYAKATDVCLHLWEKRE